MHEWAREEEIALRFLVFISLLGVLAQPRASQELVSADELGRHALKDATAMGLIIEEDEDLNTSWLKATVETRLRRAGIRVDKDVPRFMSINTVTITDTDGYSSNVLLRFYRIVALNDSIVGWAPVWTAAMLVTGSEGLEERVQSTLDRLVDRFLNDWGAMNPEAEAQ